MSQGLHQGIFDFSDGFDRPRPTQTDHHQSDNTTTVYDPTTGGGNMLSDMFDFHHSGMSSSSATQLLTNQISSGYYARLQQRPPMNSWNPNTVGALMNPHPHHHQQQPTICTSSAADETQIPQALPLYHHHEFINSHAPNLQGQGGLSLSLSSSMQQPFEITKEETPASSLYYNNINIPLQQGQVGFNGQLEVMNILRHSKYAKATRELLEEFCSVNRDGHDHAVKNRKGKRLRLDLSSNPNQPTDHRPSSSSSKKPSEPNLSSSQRFEQQRRKSGLLSMLDEIDRRYSYYCEKMQMIVNSFDAVMDLGAAKPYTGLAQKAMSRHFRCLKDGVIAQLKHTCELLGDKDTAITSGITKGETPRLKILDRNLRQQRSFNHMGMTEQETWRPQRGLPERSVNILRAWLFEHFLHPYPSDGDKHLLARQTGLTRNQVSNWFINARVRLWKPMVEEMYLEESKQEEDKEAQGETCCSSAAGNKNHSHHNQLKSLPNEFPFGANNSSTTIGAAELQPPMILNYESEMNIGVPTQIRFGDPGDVSLTLGLQQSVNMSAENNSHRFSLREFND